MVAVFPWGTCAFCEVGLWPGSARSRPRAICDAPECRSAAGRYGAARSNAIQARKWTPTTHKACTGPCGRTLPWDGEHFYVSLRAPDGSVARYEAKCKRCKRASQRKGSPGYASYRASKVRYTAKMHADPTRHRRHLENRRIAHRLARERAGLKVRPQSAQREHDEQRLRLPRLPARELGVALGRRLDLLTAIDPDATREALAESWGTSDRSIRAWSSGERDLVCFDVADRALIGAGLLPLDVWDDPAVLALWA